MGTLLAFFLLLVLIPWIIAEAIFPQKPVAWKAFCKVTTGAVCLSIILLDGPGASFDGYAGMTFGIVACISGAADWIALSVARLQALDAQPDSALTQTYPQSKAPASGDGVDQQ